MKKVSFPSQVSFKNKYILFLSSRKLPIEFGSSMKAKTSLRMEGRESRISREAGQDKYSNRTIRATQETIVRNNSGRGRAFSITGVLGRVD